MAFTIEKTDGTEIDYLARPPARFQSSIQQQGAASFSEQAATPALSVGEDVYFKDASGETLWGGSVTEITEEDVAVGGTTHRRYSYSCVDFDEVASRRIVAEAYSAQTTAAIITDLISNYLSEEGVSAGTVATGPTISSIVFNYETAAASLDELAIRSGFSWRINKSKGLDMQPREEKLAPYNISSTLRPYQSITLTKSKRDYRNTQYVRAGQDLTDSRTETFDGDGTVRTFTLSYPAGTEPTVEVNSVSKTVGIRGLETGFDWYWNKGEFIISQDDAGTILNPGDTLEITYQGLFPIIVQADDPSEIAARAAIESGSGKYERVVTDPNIDDDEAAFDKADGYIDRYGKIKEQVEYVTDELSWTQIAAPQMLFEDGSGILFEDGSPMMYERPSSLEETLDAGQLQNINLSDHGINADYLIDSVRAVALENNELRYTVRALSGKAVGGWTEFFRRMATQGQRFAIRDNEVLVRLKKVSDQMGAADSVVAATAARGGTIGTDAIGLTDFGLSA